MQSLYFTFLDGAFRYDCAACRQACCRGKGVAIDARRDLVPLLGRAPAVAPLLTPLAGGYVRLPDVSDGCWFLRDDGMCRYEQSYGRDAKFTTCRLFPFNRVFRVAALRVVDFNSVVCPLQDAHGSGQGVTHAELVSELAAVGEGPLTTSPALPPEGARELRWQVLEQALCAASESALNVSSYAPFAIDQWAQTARHLGLRGDNRDAIGGAVSALLSDWQALLGELPSEPIGAVTTRRMALLSPSLRFNVLFRKGGAPYRQAAALLPRQLLSAWFLACHAAAAHTLRDDAVPGGLSAQPLSLRALTELFQAQSGLRDLLAQLDRPATLAGPIATADLPAELTAVVTVLNRRLLDSKAASTPLGQLLRPLAAELPSAQRALLPAVLLRAGDALRFVSPAV